MADKPKSSNCRIVWAVIFLVTFMALVVMTARNLEGSHYREPVKTLVSIALLTTFSISLLVGLLKDNFHLLFWTGMLEFLFMLLPLLVFDPAPAFLPYAITEVLFILGPILWLLIPIGMFYLVDREMQKDYIKALSIVAVLSVGMWLVTSPSVRYGNALVNFVLLAILWSISLIIWFSVYRHFNKPEKAGPRKSRDTLFFAIAVLGILIFGIVVNWLSKPATTQLYYCGDGLCETMFDEDSFVCPRDCGGMAEPKEIELNVHLIGDVREPVVVTLYDTDDSALSIMKGHTANFLFHIEPQVVRATIECPSGRVQASRPKKVETGDSIELLLPDGCFESLPPEGPGTIIVQVKDAETGDPMDDVFVAVMYLDTDLPVDSVKTSAGEATFRLEADRWYYTSVFKPGYEWINAVDEKFYMVPGGTITRRIVLERTADKFGELEVCAKADGEPVTSGAIEVMGGDFMLIGNLEDVNIATEPTGPGCYVFDPLPADLQVSVRMIAAPEGCSSPEVEAGIVADNRILVELDLECD